MRNLPFHAGPSAADDGRVVRRRRAGPDHRVDEALLLDRLQQRQHGRAGEVEHDAATVARGLDEALGEAGRVVDRHVLEDALTLHPVLLGVLDDAAVDQVEAGLVRRDDDELALGAGTHGRLGAAEARVVRPHVDGREVRAREAVLGDPGDDQEELLLGVVVAVDAALDQAGAADDADHLVLLDQLGRQRGDLLGVDLLLLGDVLDRPAVDPAVVVDAVEVRPRHARDPREVDAGDVGRHGADLDRLARGRLARAEPALAGRLDVARPSAGAAPRCRPARSCRRRPCRPAPSCPPARRSRPVRWCQPVRRSAPAPRCHPPSWRPSRVVVIVPACGQHQDAGSSDAQQ